MTDKEKLDRMKKLADAMYYAAQYLTTDASGLRKAMDEYNKQEPASEDLVDAMNNYCLNARKGYPRIKDETDLYICKAFKAGTQWQKEHELKPDFSGMIIHNYLKNCWQFCDGEIPTDKCINPDYINVDVFITSKKKE